MHKGANAMGSLRASNEECMRSRSGAGSRSSAKHRVKFQHNRQQMNACRPAAGDERWLLTASITSTAHQFDEEIVGTVAL
jgi:hypothetical protein